MDLRRLPEPVVVVRLGPGAPVPDDLPGQFTSVTRTPGETSLVCGTGPAADALAARPDAVVEGPWAVLEVLGPLDLALTGVLADLSRTLAVADVPIFALATYDTDWLLVPLDRADDAIDALATAGHAVA